MPTVQVCPGLGAARACQSTSHQHGVTDDVCAGEWGEALDPGAKSHFRALFCRAPLGPRLRQSRFITCSYIVLPSGSLLGGQSPQAPLADEAFALEVWLPGPERRTCGGQSAEHTCMHSMS